MRSEWTILAGLFVAMLLVYGPFFLIDFGIHNDYRVRDQVTYTQHAEYLHLLYIGRPVNAWLFNWHQSLFTRIADFAVGRLASFLVTFGAAAMFLVLLRARFKMDRAAAFTLAVVVATLPPFVLDVGWLSNAVPGPLNLVFAAAAYGLFDAAWRRLGDGRAGSGFLGVFVALLILVAAFLNYPPTALMVLLPAVVQTLVATPRGWATARSLVARDVLFAAAGMTALFALHRLVLFPYFMRTMGPSFTTWDPRTYAFTVSFDWIGWGARVADAGRVAGNLWSTNVAHGRLPAAVALVGAVALFITARPGRDASPASPAWRVFLERLAALLVIAGFMLAPILLATGGFVGYRTILPLVAAAGCLAAWSALTLVGAVPARWGSRNLRAATVFCLVLLASWGGQRIVVAMAENAATELALFRWRLAPLRAVPTGTSVIVEVRLPPEGAYLVPTRLPFELGLLASNTGGLMDAVVHCVAEELGVPRDRYEIRSVRYNEAMSARGPGVILVDVNEAVRSRR